MPIQWKGSKKNAMKAITASMSRIGLEEWSFTRHRPSAELLGSRRVIRVAQRTRTVSIGSSSWPTRMGRRPGVPVQGLFGASCKGFNAALARSPEQQSFVKSLTASYSTTAFKQYSSGRDVQSDFIPKDDTAEVPSCDDYVGPVEIRQAAGDAYGPGGRGLFATLNVKAGELLLASNPLAVVRQKLPVYPDLRASRMLLPFNELALEVANQIRASKRQLYTLFSYRNQDMEVPWMELFREGSKWVPQNFDKFEAPVDFGLIRDIVYFNAMGCDNQANERLSGIWALPSFANHSCFPNVVQEYVGTGVMFRACGNIAEGEELTISYLGERDIYKGVETRQAKTEVGYNFRCKCERCLLEESLEAQLSQLRTAFTDLVVAAKVENRYELKKRSAIETLSKVADDVEAVVSSQDPKLGRKQQGWIRATFVDAYLAELQLAMDDGDELSSITLLRLVLDSCTSVSVTPGVRKLATKLLWEIEKIYSKNSHTYWLAVDQVLGIHEAVYGELSNDVFRRLLRS